MMELDRYDYQPPTELIARTPAAPRDAARLFVYDTKTGGIFFDTFRNVANYLPPRSFLVLNKTKVVPARVELKKPTGGKVLAVFLVNEPEVASGQVRALFDRGVELGTPLHFKRGEAGRVVRQEANIFTLEFPFARAALIALLEQQGTMPIPPYMKGSPLSEKELRKEYQTIFAGQHPYKLENVRMLSAAAPTASLHFTDRVFRALDKRRVEREYLTLHVGLGTFAPVTAEHLRTKKLHEEYFEIEPTTASAISQRQAAGEQLVAVGTTVVRALESAAFVQGGKTFLRAGLCSTNIFIQPPHRFIMPDALITNFHVPRSSLLMLVDAFLAHKGANGSTRLTTRRRRGILDLYKIAIKEKFRLFSFGDAMLVR